MAYSNPNLLPVAASTFETNSTTWQTAGSSTTALSVVTANKKSGTYGMRVQCVTTGEIFTFSPNVAVTPGETYVFHVPVATIGAVAGVTATVRITWYTDMTTANPILPWTSPITTSIPATDAFTTTAAPTVVATAPANAVSAIIRLYVNGLATGQAVCVDDVYMGVAARIAGNLYDYNTQSMEQDVAGWSAVNAALSKTNGAATSGAGLLLLRALSSAAGSVEVSPVATVPVTAGQEYVWEGWVFTGVSGLSASAVIQWIGASGEISQTVTTRSLPVSTYTYCIVVGTAPAGATSARGWIKHTATAASQSFFVDECALKPAPNEAGNLLTYDEYSAESAAPALTVANATVERFFLSSTSTEGKYTLRTTPTAAATLSMTIDRLVPVTPGTTYLVAGTNLRHNPTAGEIVSTFRPRIDWYDSSGALYQADQPDQFYSLYSSAEYVAQRVTETRTAPEGAAYAKITLEIDHSASAADYYYLDKWTLKESSPEYVLSTNSELGLIQLTVYEDGAGNDRVSVHRVDDNGAVVPVRGFTGDMVKVPYDSAPLTIEDYESPLGTSAWYQIEWWSEDGLTQGTRLYTRSVATPVLSDPNEVWIKSPGIPASNTRAVMESALEWERAARSTAFAIVGRANPIHVTSIRSGRTTTASVLVWDAEPNALLTAVLASGLPVLIQAMPGYGLDGNTYVSVGDVSDKPLGAANESGWRWTLPLTEIDRPTGGLQGSALSTWQTVLDGYATWAEVLEANESWTDVLLGG